VLARLLVGMAHLYPQLFLLDKMLDSARRSAEMLRGLGAVEEVPWAVCHIGWALLLMGDLEAGIAYCREALELGQRYDDPLTIASMLYHFGIQAQSRREFNEARDLLTQSLTVTIRANTSWGIVILLRSLAFLALDQRDYEEAQPLFEQALTLAKKLRFLIMIADCMTGLREIAFVHGDWHHAKQLDEQILKDMRENGQEILALNSIITLVETSIAVGDYEDARQRLREALAMVNEATSDSKLYLSLMAADLFARTHSETRAIELLSFILQNPAHIGAIFSVRLEEKLYKLLEQLRAGLTPEAYAAAYERGQTLSMDDLVAMLRSEMAKP
jgi:tetratricopeptide (TPR) repeat protein